VDAFQSYFLQKYRAGVISRLLRSHQLNNAHIFTCYEQFRLRPCYIPKAAATIKKTNFDNYLVLRFENLSLDVSGRVI